MKDKEWDDEDWDESEESEKKAEEKEEPEEGDEKGDVEEGDEDEELGEDEEGGGEEDEEDEFGEKKPRSREKKRKAGGPNRGINREPIFKGEGKIVPIVKNKVIEHLEFDFQGTRYRIQMNNMGVALKTHLYQELYITGKLVVEEGVNTIYVQSFV